jgi:hypothetical protein
LTAGFTIKKPEVLPSGLVVSICRLTKPLAAGTAPAKYHMFFQKMVKVHNRSITHPFLAVGELVEMFYLTAYH